MHNEQQSAGAESLQGVTPGQRRVRPTNGALEVYRELTVGRGGWGALLGYELYTFCCTNLAGLVGYGARALLLPLLLKRCAGRPTIGRGVSLRRPRDISFGRGVIVDDYVTLDVRSMEHQTSEPSITLADNCFIGRHSIVAAKGGSVELGEGSNISSYCRLASEGRLVLGKSVLVAAYTYIGPGNHLRDETGRPLIEAGMERKGGVEIGDNVWIGSRVTILDGVRIGNNAIIGAHSLVREDVPADAVVAGVPAKMISPQSKAPE